MTYILNMITLAARVEAGKLLHHLRQEMMMAWTRLVAVEVVENGHQFGIHL